MLKAILIDDEENSLNSLQHKIINHFPQIEILAAISDPVRGLKAIERLQPDIVYLDIQMPIMNGFTLLQKLRYKNFELIFVTAFDHYALKAIKFSALDYLVKPVEIEDLSTAINKAIERKQNSPNQKIELLLENVIAGNKKFERIAISSWEGLQFVKVESIVYLEASGNYTNVYLKKDKFLSSRSLKEYEEMLPPDIFVRIHNSTIINKNFLERYIRGDGGQVILEGNIILDVSKRKKTEFLNAVGL